MWCTIRMAWSLSIHEVAGARLPAFTKKGCLKGLHSWSAIVSARLHINIDDRYTTTLRGLLAIKLRRKSWHTWLVFWCPRVLSSLEELMLVVCSLSQVNYYTSQTYHKPMVARHRLEDYSLHVYVHLRRSFCLHLSCFGIIVSLKSLSIMFMGIYYLWQLSPHMLSHLYLHLPRSIHVSRYHLHILQYSFLSS